MKHFLVIRLSAFGDVAMLVPVLQAVAEAHPSCRFTVLTRKSFAPLFAHLEPQVKVVCFDTTDQHKGIKGLLRLCFGLRKQGFTHVADLHDVLRTKLIRQLVGFGRSIKHIDKGRAEKKAFIRNKPADTKLKHTTLRYLEVFQRLGVYATFQPETLHCYLPKNEQPSSAQVRIGIAPFARHRGKIYPLEQMEEVIAQLGELPEVRLFLFGGGGNEAGQIQAWADRYPHVEAMVGKFSLSEELRFMQSLHVFVSMDSANMHLASLVGVPVVSVWGATHPNLGFYGIGQLAENAVQIPLDCRPCSVFGNKPCTRLGDSYACMNGISPSAIVAKVRAVVGK